MTWYPKRKSMPRGGGQARRPIGRLGRALVLLAAMAVCLALSPPGMAQPPLSGDLVAHWDASAIEGVKDGEVVETWPDTAVGLHDATRADGDPTYVENVLNGHPVVRFDGGGDFFEFPEITNLQTIFWVLKEDADADSDYTPLIGHPTDYYFHRGDDKAIIHGSWNPPNARDGVVRINKTIVDGHTTPAPTHFACVSIVCIDNCTAQYLTKDRDFSRTWDGDMAEVLIYSRPLSEPEVEQVFDYVNDKYQLSNPLITAAPGFVVDALDTPSMQSWDFTVANSGDPGTELAITDIVTTALGPFSLVSVEHSDLGVLEPPYEVMLAKDEPATLTLTVALDPAATGIYTGTLRILSEASNTRDLALDLSVLVGELANENPVTDGLRLELDASIFAEQLPDGGKVVGWFDKSGNGSHAWLADGDPALAEDELGGLPVIRFDGFQDHFRFPEITGICSIFWVLEQDPGSSGRLTPLLGHTDRYDFHRGDNNIYWSAQWAGNIAVPDGQTRLNGVEVSGTEDPLPLGEYEIVSHVMYTLEGPSANLLTKDRFFGERVWLGDFAHVAIYDRPLDEEEEAQVGAYLADKWNLPAYGNTLRPEFAGVSAKPGIDGLCEIRFESVLYEPTQCAIALDDAFTSNPLQTDFSTSVIYALGEVAEGEEVTVYAKLMNEDGETPVRSVTFQYVKPPTRATDWMLYE